MQYSTLSSRKHVIAINDLDAASNEDVDVHIVLCVSSQGTASVQVINESSSLAYKDRLTN